jgi:NAD(P)H-dependent FMN reductase
MGYFIPVVLGSTRRDRQSVKVAKFCRDRLSKMDGVRTELVDLLELDLPMMEERLRFRDDAPESVVRFSKTMEAADSILVVTPEYNHGYPGVLKNALDYLLPEYERKPFGIVCVSAGGFGGVNALYQLRGVVLGMGGLPIPDEFAVSKVQDSFDDAGNPTNPAYEKRFKEFADELVWYTDAIQSKKLREKG